MSEHPQPLESWADDQAQARFEENAEIARKNRVLSATLRDRTEDLEEAHRRLGFYEAMDDVALSPPKWLTPKRTKRDKHLAIPSLMLTDIHWGERIEPDEIGGINKYDTVIAEQRIRRAAQGAVKICQEYLSGVEYEGLSLMLGGDMLSGDIHDELSQTNAEGTVESVVSVMESVLAAVRVLADGFGRVSIHAVAGNHGRRTRKPRAKKRAADNYDTLIYRLLARELQSDKRITMRVGESADVRFDVYSTGYLLTHGDQFRGGSGISGAMAPLMLGAHRKRRRDAAAGNPWDVMVLGHWHQSLFLRDLIVGGPVVGYNEYAFLANFMPEDPTAALWLTTPERGISAYMPVHLLDRTEEGW